MSLIKNVRAYVLPGTIGYLIIVHGDAGGGDFPEAVTLTYHPHKEKPVGVLFLDLNNAVEGGKPIEVSYARNVKPQNQYHEVQILHGGETIATCQVDLHPKTEIG